ncbi:MAG: transposase [Firmicutes bacterium]|nr:transposase [Bacillota bacterium]
MDYLHLDAGFTANEAMMPLKGIACNLVLGFRTEVGTPRFRRMTVARLRRELLLIAAVLVRHARRIFLKLAAGFRWREDYLLMRRRLEALT